MEQVNNDNLNSNGLTRPLDEVAPTANSRCSDSAGSATWEPFSSIPQGILRDRETVMLKGVNGCACAFWDGYEWVPDGVECTYDMAECRLDIGKPSHWMRIPSQNK